VVDPGPDVKFVITTSSSEITNASMAPAAMPGAASGSTTREKLCRGSGTEVGGGLQQAVVERRQPCLHDDNDERDAKRDVSEDHGPQPEPPPANSTEEGEEEIAKTISASRATRTRVSRIQPGPGT